MKFFAKKDHKKRSFYNRFELDRINLKVLLAENLNKPDLSFGFLKNSSKHKVKNRCILTSRPKGIMSYFKLSRLSFKNKASFGYLEGIRKSSW